MRTVARDALHVVLFLVGLFGTAAGLRSVDVLPFWGWVQHKLWHVHEHLDDYDTLFLGSSRMHYGLIPQRFDARMRELGIPSRSYNLAMAGQRPHDLDEMVHWLLQRRPTKLRRVVIELCSFDLEVRGGDWMANEEVEMRTARSFLPRCTTIVTGRHPLPTKLAQLGHHVLHTLSNVLRVGQGGRIVENGLAALRGQPLPGMFSPPDLGFESIEVTTLEHQKQDHAAFLDDRARYESRLASKIEDIAPAWLPGPFPTDLLLAQDRALRAAGIEPVYVVLPNVSTDFFGRRGVESLRGKVRLLELDRPQDNRPLFEFASFYDMSHVSRAGAERLSTYLADAVRERELLPLDRQVTPHRAPDVPPRLVLEGSGPAWQAVATGLPFVGTVRVLVATATGESPLGSGLVAKVALPAAATVELARHGLETARGALDLGAFASDTPLFAQLVVVLGDETLAVSDVVPIAARR